MMSISQTIGVISGINECVNLFQWVRPAISSLRSQWNGAQDQIPQDVLQLQSDLQVVLQLESDLQCLRDDLPAMYDLIDRAEWRSHENCVAKLLPNLKDAVYDADDLLDEFKWYEQKMEVEGNVSQTPFIDFFNNVVQGSFNKVKEIQKRLNKLSKRLEKKGLCEVTQRFHKSLRPETSSFPNEAKIFGRGKELKKVMGLLGVPTTSSRAHSKRKRASSPVNASASNQVSCGMSGVPVLPIVGIGGVGKTTLAQHICNHPQVKSHFNLIIWICVSDDFDVKRLTQEAIQSSCGKKATIDNLDSLQCDLANNVKNKRFLLILDDMWDDSLKEDMQCWKRFCAPLTGGLQGSVMLLTTRSPEVADGMRTMEPFPLEGLKDDVFWDFFKLCVFGSDCSNNSPELESIGRSIFPKLKGSPLAAKTLGRLLRMQLHPTHWNNVLKSELWELKQKETDILPALRLSYIYLPFHLKRCFSFCAVYPKDHKFEKDSLSEIWVAEGFVEAQGNIPIQHIGCQYFEELVNRSFFQQIRGTYVIHDLLHDMAQLVSRHDCFILKDTSDFQKVPQNVRHLSILSSTKVDCSNLLSLSKHTKIRTLLCHKPLRNATLASIMHCWCSEFRRMRVFSCESTNELPDSIGHWKHLRYLKISRDCPFKSLPSAFCCLYNLQIFHATKCKVESLPNDFGKLLNLQVFELPGKLCFDAANEQGPGIRLLKSGNQICGDLSMYNLHVISKDHAAEVKLKNMKYLDRLKMEWSSYLCPKSNPERNEKEVLQVLQPPTSLKSLELLWYPCELPSWFRPRYLPNITSLAFRDCHGIESISFSDIDLNEIPGMLVDNNDGSIGNFSSLAAGMLVDNNDGSIGNFSSLADLSFYRCQNLSSLEQFLQHVPMVKRIKINACGRLVSLPTARFADLHCLEELEVIDCPFISSQSLLSLSLKRLVVREGLCSADTYQPPTNVLDNIDCSSLTSLYLSCSRLTSIQLQMWTLLALQELKIEGCGSLTFIGESESVFTNLPRHGGSSSIKTFSSLTELSILCCHKLSTLDDLLALEYLPAVQKIRVYNCRELQSLPSERFGSFPFLKDLEIRDCPNLDWRSGLVLPSSLRRLYLDDCGDISACFPSCLESSNNSIKTFSSLTELSIVRCHKLSTLDDLLALEYLPAVEKIYVKHCGELQSLPGERFGSFPFLKDLEIGCCPNLDWRSGLVLPSSLERLYLNDCGDISACFPSCLESLTSLVSLKMDSCAGVASIPRRNIASLQELCLWNCPDLVSIGGAEAIAKIKNVHILGCPKLKQPKPLVSGCVMENGVDLSLCFS